MEQVIKLLKEKYVIDSIAFAIKLNRKLLSAHHINNIDSVELEVEFEVAERMIRHVFMENDDITNAIVDYAFKSVAKEVINIIYKKEEKKND